MKHPSLLLIVMTLVLCFTASSCLTTRDVIGLAQDAAVGGGVYAVTKELDILEDDVAAIAGAGTFLAGQFIRGFRGKKREKELQEARQAGKQAAMLEEFGALYDAQRGGRGKDGQNTYEVTVPMDGYTTLDGVVLQPHDRTIITR